MDWGSFGVFKQGGGEDAASHQQQSCLHVGVNQCVCRTVVLRFDVLCSELCLNPGAQFATLDLCCVSRFLHARESLLQALQQHIFAVSCCPMLCCAVQTA
jgi:hypothetical protein